ncbi:MAG: putative phage abortive infection protein [Oceanospirillaceae bacterium]|nr:putative phage abortive infection protein [Oceanospirillaceae bacterium]
MTEQEENSKDKKIMIIGAATVVVIIGSWVLTYFLLKNDLHNRGTFGDMFGSINALFSGLALAGIIFTILLQRMELGYQRNELRETRQEFIIQNKTLKTQRFENTFFNLLGLHHQIIEGIDYDTQIVKKDGTEGMPRGIMQKRDYEIVTIKGRDVFKNKFESLIQILSQSKSDLNVEYLKFYSTAQTDLGHYFRNLYRIIKFVNEAEFFSREELDIPINPTKYEDRIKHEVYNFSERYKYTSMIRAQLSDYELLWLFYNCLSDNGIEKFKPLIEKYTIFKNLPKDKVHDPQLIDLYEQRAFEKT